MAQHYKLFDCRYHLSLWNVMRLLTGVVAATSDGDGTLPSP